MWIEAALGNLLGQLRGRPRGDQVEGAEVEEVLVGAHEGAAVDEVLAVDDFGLHSQIRRRALLELTGPRLLVARVGRRRTGHRDRAAEEVAEAFRELRIVDGEG